MNDPRTHSLLAPIFLGLCLGLGACDGPKPAPSVEPPTSTATGAAPKASLPARAVAPPSPPATYEIDMSHSRLAFSVRHMMVSNTRGQFGRFSGTAFVDEGNPQASKINLDVETASIDSSDPKRDEHLRSADFFDVMRFPRMTFRSTHVERNGEGWRVTGELTIRDVTRPVVLDVDGITAPVKDPWGGTRRGTRARATIDRKAFGLTWNKALEAGGVAVGDDVSLDLEVELLEKRKT